MEKCVICGDESDGKHFGAQVCSACSAFFRRSITEGKSYKCRGTNSCSLKFEQRNTCRACRLKVCLLAGMQVELVNKKGPDLKKLSLHNRPVESYSTNNIIITHNVAPKQITLPTQKDSEIVLQYKILSKVLQGIDVFLNAQKTLYIVEHPNKTMADLEFELDKKSEWNRIERYCVYVVNSILTEHFEPYHQMKQEEKRKIIKGTFTKISVLVRCFFTSKYYPVREDERTATHFGYYMSASTNEFFFGSEVSQNKEECFRMHTVYLNEIRNVSCKMVKNDIREIDLAVISYLIFAQECEKQNLYLDVIEANKNLLLEEFHKNIVHTYGFEKAAVKFANVLYIQNDMTELEKISYEFRIMGKVFTTEFVDIWDELLFENHDPRISNKHVPMEQNTESE